VKEKKREERGSALGWRGRRGVEHGREERMLPRKFTRGLGKAVKTLKSKARREKESGGMGFWDRRMVEMGVPMNKMRFGGHFMNSRGDRTEEGRNAIYKEKKWTRRDTFNRV